MEFIRDFLMGLKEEAHQYPGLISILFVMVAWRLSDKDKESEKA